MESFYETLEVTPHANHVVIQAAYRCLDQHGHPDKNLDSEDAGQWMSSLNHAYAVVSDLVKRQEYDLSQGTSKIFRTPWSQFTSPCAAHIAWQSAVHGPAICLSPFGLNTDKHVS